MFKANELAMKREELERRITELSAIFQEPINYFASSRNNAKGYVKVRNKNRGIH